MDHQQALRLGAAERYVLGELPAELRDQFEEHYFDCPSCAVDLKILSTFTAASRIVFDEEAVLPVSVAPPKRQGWFHWLRPVIAAPAMLTLAAVVVLQFVGIIPSIRRSSFESGSRVYESTYRLLGATRGDTNTNISVRPGETFGLDFDFTPDRSFPRYKGTLIGPTGQTELAFDIAGEQANKELHVLVQGGKVQSGNYALMFVGLDGTYSSPAEVQRIPFSIKVQP